MRGQKKKRPISKIGRRTGADLLEGKLVRQNKDGVDNFNDYFTDQESVCSDQTTQSMVSFVKNNSGWTSSLDNNFISPLKSPLKEILNKRNEGFEGDFSDSSTSERSRRPKVSKKKVMQIEEHSENINFAISKMTQTSHLLDETASKNITFLKETNFDESSGIKNSNISKSSLLPDTSVAPYNIQDIHLSTNDTNCASSQEKSNKGHESYIDKTRKSLSNAEKSGKNSILRETRRNKYDSSGKERNSITERSLKALCNTSIPSQIKEKGNKNNSFEGISQCTHTFSGSMNLKEDISSKRDNNLNRLESLKFPCNGSEEKDDKQKHDSADIERNSIAEESLKALSNTSITSHNKGNKKNSSEKRSRRISTSSELQRLQENVSSKKDNNLSRSRSLMSSEKRSKEKNGRRKSSLRKSPISLKRKMTVNETQCVQNRRDDDNKTNYSEEISRQYKLNFFEALKLKENMSSEKVNRSENLISPQKEREEQYDVQKSSLGKSPRVPKQKMQMSETPCVEYSENGSNERNSSEERSQHLVNSSEMLKLKENKSLSNDKSVPRSKSLVCSQKDKKEVEEMQKSSPKAVKRKMQESNEVENVICETMYIQKEGDNSKNKNSIEKSPQLAAMSSEVSKLEKKKSSKNRKSGNKSEVFVSSQKENKRNSSARKSSCNLIQISNISRSQEKAETKKHSPRRKIDFSKITEDILQEKKQPPYSLRRSSRRRFPPLAYWRNERLMFTKSTSGNITCVGVDAGQPEDDYAFRKIKRRYERETFKSSNIKKQDLSKRIGKTTILDSLLGRELKLNLHRPFITCEWFPREGEDSKLYSTSRVVSSKFFYSGFLDIPGYSRKGECHSEIFNTYFIVLKGVVDVVIGTNRFTFKKFDCFIVPFRAMYSISNNASSNALLHYCALKKPIFEYQELEI